MKLLSLQLGVIMWGLLTWSMEAQDPQKPYGKDTPAQDRQDGKNEIGQEDANKHNRILRQAIDYLETDSQNFNPGDERRESTVYKRNAPPLDKIGGSVVMREMMDEPAARALDSLSGESFGVSRRYDLHDQHQPMSYYRKLIESRGFPPRPKAIFDEIDRMGIQGFGKRMDEIDRVGFRNFGKKNFDEIDKSGFRDFGKRNFDEIDKSGFRDFGKRNFDEIDKSGFRDFGKRYFDEIDRAGFRDFGKKNFDEIDKSGFRDFGKRNFDEIDKSGFRDFGKRNFDEIDKSGFRDFGKRNFDEIDKSGFRDFGKRNFDEIDKSGFRDFGKRSIYQVPSNRFPGAGTTNLGKTKTTQFSRGQNMNMNEAGKYIPDSFRNHGLQELPLPGLKTGDKRSVKFESTRDER